jgi:hypothetical protein
MKFRASLLVLVVLLVVVPLSHLNIESSDDSWLVRVDGVPVDVPGLVSDTYSALTRSCSQVQALGPTDPRFASAQEVIRQESPPHSLSAQVVDLRQQGDWALAQVRFAELQSAVVLLQASGAGYAMSPVGVWSGSTHPHRPGPVVRRYLRSRVPQAPGDLVACFDDLVTGAGR